MALLLVDRRARNMSPKTIAYYEYALGHWVWWCERHGVCELGEVTAGRIRQFVSYLQEVRERWDSPSPRARRPLAPSSVLAHVRALKAWCRFLVAEGELEVDPFVRVKLPAVPKLVVPTFDDAQLEALFAQTGPGVRCGLRNQALLWLLVDTGIRASELCGLRVGDVGEGRIRVRGKGAKERYCPLGAKAVRAILRYAQKERPESDSDRLILTEEGGELTVRRLDHILADLGRRAGVTGVRMSAHTFRHCNATRRLRAGWDVRTLQSALGHSSLASTMRYLTTIGDADVERAHQAHGVGDALRVRVR